MPAKKIAKKSNKNDTEKVSNGYTLKRDLILLLDTPNKSGLATIKAMKKRSENDKYRFALVYDEKKFTRKKVIKDAVNQYDEVIPVDFGSNDSMIIALKPYREKILAVMCRTEAMIPQFQMLIPHVPYARTPVVKSLDWSINKIQMRKRFRSYDKKITPKFLIVKDQTKATIDEIVKKIGFPLVVKPAGLAQSLLVTVVYHREELEEALKKIFRTINKIYKESKRKANPEVLVEEFIEGTMHSIDSYVNSRGTVTHCPMVDIKTGKEIGFDDFFGYQQTTPSKLSKKSIEAAQEVAEKGIHALGLRSIVAHVELMKDDHGWRIVEIGPRIGGFRDDMYKLSYGINHRENSVYITIPKAPNVPRKVKGHTAVLKIFAKSEGRITALTGIKKAQKLESFKSITINKQIGDRAIFAKHGGKSIFNITFFNEERSKLLADIRRFEKLIKIKVSKSKKKKVK